MSDNKDIINKLKLRKAKANKKRKETRKNSEELNKTFPGIEDLRRYGRGVMTDDTNEDVVLEPDEQHDQLEDDEVEEEETEVVFPASWVKIATRNESIQKEMRDKLLTEAKKKKETKRKPHCNKKGGNPAHSQSDGKFTSSDDPTGSWSIRHPKTGADCDAGTYRKTGPKKKVWTKLPCGRDSDTELCGTKNGVRSGRPVKKAKKITESDTDIMDELFIDMSTQEELGDRLQRLLDRDPKFLSHLAYLVAPLNIMQKKHSDRQDNNSVETHSDQLDEKKKKKVKSPFRGHTDEEIRSACRSRYNLMSFDEFLALLNKIEAAKKGVQNQTQ
jgi:hypothetical protein